MGITILSLLALIPPAILLWIIYKQDKVEKEPAKLLLKVFLFGCLSCIPAVVLELVGGLVVTAMFGSIPAIYLIVEYFVVVAMSEEFVKMMAAKLATWKSPEFNYKFDAIVYCVFSALGFAALENLLYILPREFTQGVSVGISRGLLSIPGHCIFGVIVGYWYGLAKEAQLRGDKAGAKKLLWKSILFASLAHGFYDYALSTGSVIMMIAFFIFVIAMDIWAIIFVRKQSKGDVALPADVNDPAVVYGYAQQPIPGQPVAPVAGQPVYGQPAYSQPGQAPVYGQPAYSQPGQAPVFGQAPAQQPVAPVAPVAPAEAPVEAPAAAPVEAPAAAPVAPAPAEAATPTETPLAAPVDTRADASNNSNSFK